MLLSIKSSKILTLLINFYDFLCKIYPLYFHCKYKKSSFVLIERHTTAIQRRLLNLGIKPNATNAAYSNIIPQSMLYNILTVKARSFYPLYAYTVKHNDTFSKHWQTVYFWKQYNTSSAKVCPYCRMSAKYRRNYWQNCRFYGIRLVWMRNCFAF